MVIMCSQASAETTILKGKGILEANGTGTAIAAGIGQVSIDGTGDILVLGRNVTVNMQGFNCSKLAPMVTVCKGTGYGNITAKPKKPLKRNRFRVVFSGTASDFEAAGKGRAVLMGDWNYTEKPLPVNAAVNATGGRAILRMCLQEARAECLANATADESSDKYAIRKCLQKAKAECLQKAKAE